MPIQDCEAENGEPSHNIYILRCSRGSQAKGTAVSCVATRELDNWMQSGGSADEEELIMNITATAYAGERIFATDRKT
jgi:hypothetical protein